MGLFLFGLYRRHGLLAAVALGFAGAFGFPRWLLSSSRSGAKRSSSTLSRRRRHHRARHQGRPAAARLPEDDHDRSAGAGESRNSAPSSRRRPSACRWAKPAASCTSTCRCRRRTSSASSFDPAKGRRQPGGGARQPVARAARAQEDEGQDPGDVAGGEGIRSDHRRPADRGDDPRSISPARTTSGCC